MRREGFLAALQVRGRSVQLQPSGPSLSCLTSPVRSDQFEHRLDPDAVQACELTFLREDLTGASIIRGSIFKDVESGGFWRVTKIDAPIMSVTTTFTCEETSV